MRDFPRWLLVMAFLCVTPIFACPLYLFGGLRLFAATHFSLVNFLLYVLQNLVWVIPIALFFVSLDLYRRGYEKAGIVLVVIGLLLAAASFAMLALL